MKELLRKYGEQMEQMVKPKKQIKFRGQTLKGEWVYGNLSVLKNTIDSISPGFYISNDFGMPFAYSVRPETIGQFTGLFDRNGNEIYDDCEVI